MDISNIQQKILADDDFVLSETAKIQYACGLKGVIRYELERAEDDFSESVAEHTNSMQVVADYFLRIEPMAATLDQSLVKTMITWHDMDEIETGDKISWKKTAADIKNELTAWKDSVKHIPEVLIDDVSAAVAAYEERSTPEGKFVKAVDKLEPLFHLYCPKGRRWTLAAGLTFEASETTKIQYIQDFPYMKRFMDVLHDRMNTEGFFPS